MPELAAWEAVYVGGTGGAAFLSDPNHGLEALACLDCHAASAAEGEFGDYAADHVGVTAWPSLAGACDGCHADIAATNANSLHTNLWGEKAAVERRGQCVFSETPAAQAGFARNCGDCHTSCGQCHVSRPLSVGGGFIGGHLIRRTPDMTLNCTACHGSRVGHDYTGEDPTVQSDIHYARGHRCELCHRATEMHGDGLSSNASGHYEHRYEVASMPRCEDCHVKSIMDAAHADDPDWHGEYHDAHWEGLTGVKLQCQVCHSQPYKNCTFCHVSDPSGYDIEPSVLALKIGKNTEPATRGEYDYTVVRHTPVHQDTYETWPLALPGYDDAPTWKYASPHNIRTWTAQTTVDEGMGCGTSCHDRSGQTPLGWYLREIDLQDGLGGDLPDAAANAGVVILEGDLH
ncbi:hypothetical protein KDL67_10385 [bacterium]|nr:hypothetical protein [bacterium]